MSRMLNRLARLVTLVLASAIVPTAYGLTEVDLDISIKHDWIVGTESFPVGLREYEGGFGRSTFILFGDNYVQTAWSAPAIAFAAALPLATLLALAILAIACVGGRRSRSKDS